jgi:hypothetical protein
MNKDKKFLVIQKVRNKSGSFTVPNMELLGIKQCRAKETSDGGDSCRELPENCLVGLTGGDLSFNNPKSQKDS